MSRKTDADYRHAAARRQKQWREGQKQAGRRPFTLWLNAAAADELDRRVAEHGGAKVEAWREIIGNLLLHSGVIIACTT